MDKFREIYNDELRRLKNSITQLNLDIFDHHDTKGFIYAVCKRVVASQQAKERGKEGVWG